MRRLSIALALLVLTTSVAEAARDDDFDFAQRLVDRKFYDLAKEQFDRIIKDASGAEQKANGELGLALLLKAQASDIQGESKRTPDEVLAVFEEAEKRFDAFLSTYSNHPKRTDAKFEVGNLLQMKGVYLTRMMEKEPAKEADYRQMADKAFGGAIDLFSDVAGALKDREEDDWNYRKARYFHAVTHYHRGLVYAEDSGERRNAMEKATELLIDFIWDNEENILGGYAYFFYGLSKAKLNEPDEALEYLATAATNYQVPDRQGNPADYGIWTELFMQTYYKLGEYCHELGTEDRLEFAIVQFEEMMKRVPDVYDRKTGHFALLEYAKCLSGLKRYEDAIAIVTKVSKRGDELAATTEWGAATAFLANRLLNRIIADTDGSISLPPPDLMKAAMGKMTSRDWDQAIRVFQQVVTATEGKATEMEFGPHSWMQIGECYYRNEKYLEALFAYEHIARKYEKLPIAGDAAYFAYRAATALHGMTKDKRDEDLKKQKRSEFATKYKDHPRSIDLQYYEGADLIADADSARIGGKSKEANETYERALEQLTGVKPTSILYAKAMARRGEILFQTEKYDEALKVFADLSKYIEDPKNLTTDDERAANRKQAQAIAAYYAARCISRQEKWDDVLAKLDGYETTYADENVMNFHAPVKYERLRAYLESGRLEAGEKQALEMRDLYPDNPLTYFSFHLLGKAFQEQSAKAREAKDEKGWRENLTKAAEYYSYYLSKKDAPTWEEWQTIGYWYRELEVWPKAEEFLKRALEMLTALVDRNPNDTKLKESQDGLMVLLSEMMINQGDFGGARDVFEKLLILDPAGRDRVFQLLEMQEHTEATLKELMAKIRRVPSLMEGLARAYIELGGSPEVYLRALTLLKILAVSDRELQFTPQWWGWKFLTCRAYCEFGVAYKDKAALQNVINLVDQWDTLGVLKNAPQYQEFLKLRQRADLELRKLGG